MKRPCATDELAIDGRTDDPCFACIDGVVVDRLLLEIAREAQGLDGISLESMKKIWHSTDDADISRNTLAHILHEFNLEPQAAEFLQQVLKDPPTWQGVTAKVVTRRRMNVKGPAAKLEPQEPPGVNLRSMQTFVYGRATPSGSSSSKEAPTLKAHPRFQARSQPAPMAGVDAEGRLLVRPLTPSSRGTEGPAAGADATPSRCSQRGERPMHWIQPSLNLPLALPASSSQQQQSGHGALDGHQPGSFDMSAFIPADESETEYPAVDMSRIPTAVRVESSGLAALDGEYYLRPVPSRGKPAFCKPPASDGQKPWFLYWNKKWRISSNLGAKRSAAQLPDAPGVQVPSEPYPHTWQVVQKDDKYMIWRTPLMSLRVVELT